MKRHFAYLWACLSVCLCYCDSEIVYNGHTSFGWSKLLMLLILCSHCIIYRGCLARLARTKWHIIDKSTGGLNGPNSYSLNRKEGKKGVRTNLRKSFLPNDKSRKAIEPTTAMAPTPTQSTNNNSNNYRKSRRIDRQRYSNKKMTPRKLMSRLSSSPMTLLLLVHFTNARFVS